MGGDRFRQVALYGIYRLPVRPPKSDSTEKCCYPGGPVRHPPGGGRDAWLCTSSTSGRAVQLSRSGGGLGPPSGVGALYVISARPVSPGPAALYAICGPGWGGLGPPGGTSSSVCHLLPRGARPPEGCSVRHHPSFRISSKSQLLRLKGGEGALYAISRPPVRNRPEKCRPTQKLATRHGRQQRGGLQGRIGIVGD